MDTSLSALSWKGERDKDVRSLSHFTALRMTYSLTVSIKTLTSKDLNYREEKKP